jgi:hypothetical protein
MDCGPRSCPSSPGQSENHGDSRLIADQTGPAGPASRVRHLALAWRTHYANGGYEVWSALGHVESSGGAVSAHPSESAALRRHIRRDTRHRRLLLDHHRCTLRPRWMGRLQKWTRSAVVRAHTPSIEHLRVDGDRKSGNARGSIRRAFGASGGLAKCPCLRCREVGHTYRVMISVDGAYHSMKRRFAEAGTPLPISWCFGRWGLPMSSTSGSDSLIVRCRTGPRLEARHGLTRKGHLCGEHCRPLHCHVAPGRSNDQNPPARYQERQAHRTTRRIRGW